MLALWGAAAASAQTRPPRKQAGVALSRLAADVARAPIAHDVRRHVAADLRASARRLSARRGPCAAAVAVGEAWLATHRTRGKVHRRLAGDIARAVRALQRLPGTAACAPRVRSVKLRRLRPRFDAKAPPGPLIHEQGGEEDYSVPRDPHAKPTGPRGAPTDVTSSGAGTTANVTDPLQIFGSVDLGDLGGLRYPQEPEVAQKGGVVLYSGNSYGLVSFDGGSTFDWLNPNRVFGNDQTICCDSVVRYAPSIDRFIWLFQYWCPPETLNGQAVTDCDRVQNKDNRYRIAVISPAQLLANREDPTHGWTVYELTASSFSSSSWLDYPDMSVGTSELYISCDEVGVGGLNIRLPLRDLLASGPPSAQWFRGSGIFWRTAEDSGTNGIFLKNDTDSRDLAYVWPDGGPAPYALGLRHTTRPDDGYSTLTASGQNWNDRAGSPVVKGATMQGGDLWVAWAAGRDFTGAHGGATWPQPHIQIAVYDTSNLRHAVATGAFPLLSEHFIWSRTFAYTDPILAANSDGDVAITFAGADAHSMPSPYVGVITNRPFALRAAVSLGPAKAVEGDYAGLARDYDDPTQFVAANTFTTTGLREPFPVADWLYTRFGRGPNPPPPRVPPTSLTITRVTGTAFDCCFYGDTFHTEGHLDGGPPNATIEIDYSTYGDRFSHTITTSGSGDFSDAWTSPTLTTDSVWTITAHYAGDTTHGASASDQFLQTVQPPPG